MSKIENGFISDVNTGPYGLIEQEIYEVTNGVKKRLVRRVIDTQERQTREALIRLGWTPPEGS